MQVSGVELTEVAQVYVVHLMVDFSRTENVHSGTDRGDKQTLVDLLNRARDASEEEAVRIYKHLGDRSLVKSGFFSESVERELVGVDYYVTMGETAYRSVSALTRRRPTSSVLFDELASRFSDLVELLANMSLHGERSTKVSDDKLLDLIDRYRRTGKREILEALAAQGVVLRPGLDSDDELVH